MSMNQRSVDVLERCWVLELSSPQKIPKVTGRGMRTEDRQVVEWPPRKALAWQVLNPPRPVGKNQRVWRQTVVLGVYDFEATYQRLGGDPTAPGAKAWAAATANLVYVAASGAKRRLYIIGDQAAWATHNYFNQLAAALDEPRQDR